MREIKAKPATKSASVSARFIENFRRTNGSLLDQRAVRTRSRQNGRRSRSIPRQPESHALCSLGFGVSRPLRLLIRQTLLIDATVVRDL